jgi:splicing factor 3B subunit 3
LDPKQFGRPYAGPGNWASCIRYLNPFTSETLSLIELDHNEAAISLATIRFAQHQQELLLVVGTVSNYIMTTKQYTKGSLLVYRFIEDGQKLELYHQTDIDGVPFALCPFQGKLLVGIGSILRMYEIGKKKLLRKCESKVLVISDRIFHEILLKYIHKGIEFVFRMQRKVCNLHRIDILIIGSLFLRMILHHDG